MPRTRTEPTIPSDHEALAAREAIRILDAQADGEVLRVQMLAAGREVATLDLPPAAVRLLKEMLQEMAAPSPSFRSKPRSPPSRPPTCFTSRGLMSLA